MEAAQIAEGGRNADLALYLLGLSWETGHAGEPGAAARAVRHYEEALEAPGCRRVVAGWAREALEGRSGR
jgi:hypothetical protein